MRKVLIPRDTQLNMVGPATEKTGYGIHFINLAKALNKEVSVSMTPRSRLDPDLSNDQEIREMTNTPFNYAAPTICIWFADAMQLFAGSYRIGFPVFESNILTREQMYHLCNLDAIYVTSCWAWDVIEDSAVKFGIRKPSLPRIEVMCEGYDPGVFQRRDIQENYLTLGWRRPYIQNVGKWEERKGHPQIIRVLGEVADEGYEFTFIGLWNNNFNPSWREHANHHLTMNGFYQTKPGVYAKGECLIILPESMKTSYDVANFMSMCDFGLYPHKAEGWCLPILESMGCGCPIIATNYSGPTEYLSPECGILLEPEGFEDIHDDIFFRNANGQWAKVSDKQVKAAVIQMLDSVGHESIHELGDNAERQAAKFTWSDSADLILTDLKAEGLIKGETDR